jgi:hypothetical protein
LKSAIDGWEKIAQYTEPKLKSVEISGPNGEDLVIGAYEVKFAN